MASATFIGDEFTGAGFRLAGLRVLTPDPERTGEVFRQALTEASLVIITGDIAARLAETELNDAVKLAAPPVAVVPAASGKAPGPDLVREVRMTLGMEA
jgi:vacuolar-type H+-ATPase subunit F/Vma7